MEYFNKVKMETGKRKQGCCYRQYKSLASYGGCVLMKTFKFKVKISHPGRWSGLGSSLASRDRRVVRGVGAALGGDLCNQHPPLYYPSLHSRPPASERHTAWEERHCQGILAQSAARNPATNLAPGSSYFSCTTSTASAQASLTTPAQLQASHPGLTARGGVLSSESLTLGGGVSLSGGARKGGGEHHPTSHIPRAAGSSASSSLHSL
ncbi:hypothetical protein JOQ06_011632, partial [Pogonophryne albipinna]